MSYTFIVEETTKTNLRHAIPIHTREGHERLYVYEASDTAIEKIDSTTEQHKVRDRGTGGPR